MELDDCLFTDNMAEFGGAVYAETTTRVRIEKSFFVHNGASDGGALFITKGAKVGMKNSTFLENRGSGDGGAMKIRGRATVDMETCTFSHNVAKQSGGSISLSGKSILTATNGAFYSGSAITGGAIDLKNGAKVAASMSTFEKNSASGNGGAIWSYGDAVLSLNGSTFINNSATGSPSDPMFIRYDERLAKGGAVGVEVPPYKSSRASMAIHNSIFARNKANHSGGAVFMGSDDSADVSCNMSSTVFEENEALLGGAVRLSFAAVFSMTSVRFARNEGVEGGALHMAWDPAYVRPGSIRGTGLEFLENTARVSGGALFAIASLGGGGGPFAALSSEPLPLALGSTENIAESAIFQDSSFGRNKAGEAGGAVALSGPHVGFFNSTFANNSVGASDGVGGAVALRIDSAFSGRDIRMTGNTAAHGGGIYAEDALLDFVRAEIHGNNAYRNGGGLHVRFGWDFAGQDAVGRMEQCIISNNSARAGGGLSFYVDRLEESIEFDSLFFYFRVAQSHFVGNTADETGGALFTNVPRSVYIVCDGMEDTFEGVLPSSGYDLQQPVPNPRAHPCKETWVGNAARNPRGGNVMATAAVASRVCTSGAAACVETSRGCRGDVRTCSVKGPPIHIANHTSGRVLEYFAVEVLDLFGKPAYGQMDLMRIVVRVEDPGAFAFGQLIVDAGGVANFTDVRFLGGVNRTYSMVLNFEPKHLPDINLRVSVRGCLPGEVLDVQKEHCVECPEGMYSFDPMQECKGCPSEAKCGPSTITPNDGYWHSKSTSAKVHQCASKYGCQYKDRSAKLEFQARQLHYDGKSMGFDDGQYQQCSEGYGGVLCGTCTASHGKIRSGECIGCGDRKKNVALVCLSALWYAALVFIVAKNAFPAARDHDTDVVSTLNAKDVGILGIGSSRDFADTSPVSAIRSPSEARPLEGQSACTGILIAGGSGDGRVMETKEGPYKANGKNYASDIFKILINFLQVTSIAVYINIDWTNMVAKTLGAADLLASGSDGLFSLECAFPRGSAHRATLRTIVNLTMPLATTLAFILLSTVLGWMRGKETAHIAQFWRATMLAVFYVSYIDTTRNALRVLDCVRIDDDVEVAPGVIHGLSAYWTEDTGVECYKGSHLYLTALLAAPLLLCVTLGMPILLMVTQMRRRSTQGRHSYGEPYGFLYRSYRDGCQYWEVAIMTRKGLLAALTVFRLSLGPNLQASLALGILGIAFGAQSIKRPFVEDGANLNALECMSLACSVFAFFAAIIFNDPHTSRAGAIATSLLFVACLVAVLGILVAAFLHELVRGIEGALDKSNVPFDRNASLVKKTALLFRNRRARLARSR
ncbi:unnamed protein product [Ostreobium quekettii]|uniref:Polymorphic outer membrane protein n=1 Tax=Ostreobium quekettii TaxID=121088 RepID=A0A8S1JAT3_9CHLO|nr:unnamed protein product [Ostreobium quekettii]